MNLLDQSLRCELLSGNQNFVRTSKTDSDQTVWMPRLIWVPGSESGNIFDLLYHPADLTSPITYGHGGVGYYMYMHWFGCYIHNFLALFVMRSWLRNTFSVNYQTKKVFENQDILLMQRTLFTYGFVNNKQSTVSAPRSFIFSWRLIFLSLFMWFLTGMTYRMGSILK